MYHNCVSTLILLNRPICGLYCNYYNLNFKDLNYIHTSIANILLYWLGIFLNNFIIIISHLMYWAS